MKSMKWMGLVLVMVLLAAMPLSGLAEEMHFEGPLECERMRIDSIDISSEGGDLMLTILYTLHENLTAEDKEGLELMSFNIVVDAEATEYAPGFKTGSMGAVNRDLGAAIVDGEQYTEESTWGGFSPLPDTLILRPFYKFLGEWGQAIVLDLTEGTFVTE